MNETKNELDTITSKILSSDPSVIYSREYTPKELMAGIQEKNLDATFALSPYENRIIIPRIGENIPTLP